MAAATATQPLPRVRRTPPAVRVLLAVVVLVYAIFAVGSGVVTLLDVAARHEFTTHATYAGVHRLVVDNSVGDVHLVRARAGAPVSVTAHVTEGLGTPHRAATHTAGGRLKLSASCSNVLVGSSCDVGYTVAVAAGVRVSIDSSGGDISVRDYAGSTPLSLSSSAGDIDATGITVPALRLDSSAGDVRADGIRAPVVHAESSAGDARLGLAAPARTLTARSSAGDVRLTVPDVPYRVKASSSAGAVSDGDIQQSPRAPRGIDASSSAGDVTISPGP
jgi:Toastrack DUF4097